MMMANLSVRLTNVRTTCRKLRQTSSALLISNRHWQNLSDVQSFSSFCHNNRLILPASTIANHAIKCQRTNLQPQNHSLERRRLSAGFKRDPQQADSRGSKWIRGTALVPRSSMSKLATVAVDSAPSGLQPYLKLMRLDKPIGTWLLFWPAGWSIGLAAEAGCWPDFTMLALFGSGALIMRGAGCVVNDMWDRDIDSKVERTATRPLASGQLSMTDAWMFLAALLATGDVILMQLNWNCVMLGASSLGLIVCYPLTKRVFNWPQLFLGMVFNWGALMGWSAVHGMCDFAVCLPLYLAGISWTLVYDTIYAHQDKKDDVKVGVKSTALTFGQNSKYYLLAFSTSMATGLTVTGLLSQQTYPYYMAVGAAFSTLIYQIVTLRIDDPNDCGKKFVANSNLGFLIMAGIIASTILKPKKEKEQVATL